MVHIYFNIYIYIYIDVVRNLIHFYVIALTLKGNKYLVSNFRKTFKDDTTAFLGVSFS